jgi:hypothetical protein
MAQGLLILSESHQMLGQASPTGRTMAGNKKGPYVMIECSPLPRTEVERGTWILEWRNTRQAEIIPAVRTLEANSHGSHPDKGAVNLDTEGQLKP